MLPGQLKPEARESSVELRRILVVDEAMPIRRKLGEILARTGLAPGQLRVVATADEALEVFALEHPDLVFAELVGPDPQVGLEMVLEMLSIDPHARIVLVTAEDPEGPLVRQAIRGGVFAVLAKPLRHDKVRQILSEIDSEEGGIERFR